MQVAAIEFSRGIEDAWARVATFVPKLLGALVILVVGFVIAKAVAKIVNGLLERVGFDQAVERGGIRKALEKSKYDPSDILAKVAFWAIFLLVLQMAFGVFGPNPVSDLLASVIAFLPKLFVAIVIVVVAAAIATAVKEIITTALGGLSYGNALANGASIAIIVLGAFAALSQLQIAPAIVNGLFYALLAVVVGSAIVAIGGGGIQPMRTRWEQALQRYDEEKQNVRSEAEGGAERVRTRAREVRAEAKSEMASAKSASAGSSRRSK